MLLRTRLSTAQLSSRRLRRPGLLQLPQKIGAEEALRRVLIFLVAGGILASEKSWNRLGLKNAAFSPGFQELRIRSGAERWYRTT